MDTNTRALLPFVLVLSVLFPESQRASASDSARLSAMPEMEFTVGWAVSSLAFAPNGRYLAAADLARGVYLWNLKSRRKVWEIKLPPVGAVSEEDVALAFTADGKMLLLASYVRDPLVLDASSGETLRTFGHEGEWFAPAVSLWRKDGTETAVTSSNGDLHFWNPSTGKEVMGLKGAGREVISLQVAKNAPRIALGLWPLGIEHRVKTARLLVRELPSGRIIFDVGQSRFAVRQIAISPNGKHLVCALQEGLVSASEDGLVCWSIERKERLWSKKEVCGGLAISPDGKMLLYGSGSRVVLCDLLSGKTLSAIHYGSHTISAVTFTDDGTLIAVGVDRGAIAVWRVLPGSEQIRPGGGAGKRKGP